MNRRAEMEELARIIDDSLRLIYGEPMAFIVLTGPMEGSDLIRPDGAARCDYIGNCDRESSIEWMEETAGRFKGGE